MLPKDVQVALKQQANRVDEADFRALEPSSAIREAIKYHTRNGIPDFRSLPAYYMFLNKPFVVDRMLAMLLADKGERVLHGPLSGIWARVQMFKSHGGWSQDPKPKVSQDGRVVYDGKHRIMWALAKNLPCPVEFCETRPNTH